MASHYLKSAIDEIESLIEWMELHITSARGQRRIAQLRDIRKMVENGAFDYEEIEGDMQLMKQYDPNAGLGYYEYEGEE